MLIPLFSLIRGNYRFPIRSCLLLPVLLSVAMAEVLVPANNPNINYYGRFDSDFSAQVRFNWSGAAIEASFPGPSIGINLQDGQADYDIEIDGVLDTVLRTVPSISRYSLGTGFSPDAHTIRVVQRSENHWNAAVFGGFYLADGKTLLPAPPKPLRKIEFIGDSYTVGYGNESPGRSCTSAQLRAYTNTNKSFGPLVARAFHAQSVVLGWSGEGMVRNYGDALKKSAKPFPVYYGTTLGEAGGAWNFSQWVPHIVVICLGTNDFSTTPYPDDTAFIRAYHSFIGTVLGNYPEASILCVTTHTGPLDGYLQRIVAAETTTVGHKKVYYAEFPQSLAFNGCDYHPSAADDQAIAKALVGSIMKNCGWDTAAVATIAAARTRATAPSLLVTTAGGSGDLLVRVPREIPSGTGVSIISLHGHVVAQGALNRDRLFRWNAQSAPPGCYLVSLRGSAETKTIVKR